MLSPEVAIWLARIPFIILALAAYWFILWVIPANIRQENSSLSDNKPSKSDYFVGALVSHVVALILLWVAWSVYFMIEGKQKYQEQYIEYQQKQK